MKFAAVVFLISTAIPAQSESRVRLDQVINWRQVSPNDFLSSTHPARRPGLQLRQIRGTELWPAIMAPAQFEEFYFASLTFTGTFVVTPDVEHSWPGLCVEGDYFGSTTDPLVLQFSYIMGPACFVWLVAPTPEPGRVGANLQ